MGSDVGSCDSGERGRIVFCWERGTIGAEQTCTIWFFRGFFCGCGISQTPEIEAYSKRIKFGGMFSNFVETTNVRLNGVYPEDEVKTAPLFLSKNSICAEERLQKCVEKYSKSAPQLAEWIEENIPEGLAVFALPSTHRKRMRTTNMLERLHEEIKRRTRVARLFPNEASLLRLVSAIEMEISEDWISGKRYLDMKAEMENENESANSNEKRIYRKNVA